MKKEDIPFYNDPEDFVDGNNKFPCDTQYMQYDPLTHRYFLTAEGLTYYNIDAERKYITDNPNKVNELIERSTKKIYDTICYKVGIRLFPTMMYRIATVPNKIFGDQYSVRKQFEQILVDEARWLCNNGDSARYSNYNMEHDIQQNPVKPDDDMRDLNDVSPESLRSLDMLGLTRWFNCSIFRPLDTNKY